MRKLLLTTFSAATLAACLLPSATAQKPTQQVPVPMPPKADAPAAAPQDAAAPAKLDPARYDHFGDGIAAGTKAVPLADVLKDPSQFLDKPVRIEGPVTAVCQVKGCWMHLGSASAPVMVKFKDYGFFMPKDAAGRTAIVEGSMKMVQETVEQTRHYLEDAGKHDEAQKITEGRKLLTFVASGVALQKKDAPADQTSGKLGTEKAPNAQ